MVVELAHQCLDPAAELMTPSFALDGVNKSREGCNPRTSERFLMRGKSPASVAGQKVVLDHGTPCKDQLVNDVNLQQQVFKAKT